MSSITIWQGILCGIIYWLAVGNLPFVGLWTLQRPLVCGALVGLVLGQPVEGAVIGASINLVYLGFISAGGSMPADMSLAGILGTAYALAGGLDAKTALALAVPIGILGTVIWTSRMTVDCYFVHLVDRYIDQEDYGKIWRGTVLYPQIFCASITILPCAAAVYFGSNYIGSLLEILDGRFLTILQIIGGLMPCLGIAITLRYIFEGDSRIFMFVGFLLSVYTELPMHIIGIIAVICAIIYIQLKESGREESSSYAGYDYGDEEEASYQNQDRSKKESLLPRSALVKSWLIWETFPQTCYNYERMMGQHMAFLFTPLLSHLYPKEEDGGKRRALMKREMSFFNTHVEFGACVPGMAIALEEQMAMGEQVPDSLIKNLKVSFMGAMAGLGDTIWQGVFLPLMLAFCIDITRSGEGNVWGSLIYVTVILISAYLLSYNNFMFGYRTAGEAIVNLMEHNSIKKIITGSSITGCMVMGCLIEKYVNVICGITIPMENGLFVLQEELFDAICPRLLSLLITLLVYYLLQRKQWKTGKIILMIVVLGIIGGYTGILTY